jgi:hypothetical protein
MTIHKLDIPTRPSAHEAYKELAALIDSFIERNISLADICLMLDLYHHAVANELIYPDDDI